MKKLLSVILVFGFVFSGGGVSAEIPALVIINNDLSSVKAEHVTISGKVRENSTVMINGEDAVVKRKFRHTIYLDDAPSITTANIELTDKDGKTLESFDFQLKNIFRRKVGIYLGKKFIEVDDKRVELEVAPELVDGYSMIPLEILYNFDGITTNSIAIAGSVFFDLGSISAVIAIGSIHATINGEVYQMGMAPYMKENQIMIHLPLIYEAFGFKAGEKWGEDFVIVQEIIPESDTPQMPLPPEDILKFDSPHPKIINQTQYEIIGEIAPGTNISVNSKESNIFHQFDHKVSLNKAPSFTPIKFEVFDADGNILETKNIDFENQEYLIMKVWIGKDEMEVNGKKEELDVPATILHDRTMIPFRAVADSFNAVTEWVSKTKTVVFKYGKTKVEMPIGSETVKVNGVSRKIHPPATILNGRTMVPLRFVAETFDAEVQYDANEKLVTISKVIHPERE